MEKVYVSSKRQQWAIILIEDDGPGIPEEQYKNVLKPFLGWTKRSLNDGVGLGLAIIKMLSIIWGILVVKVLNGLKLRLLYLINLLFLFNFF